MRMCAARYELLMCIRIIYMCGSLVVTFADTIDCRLRGSKPGQFHQFPKFPYVHTVAPLIIRSKI